MNYTIVAIVKGEKFTITNVGEPGEAFEEESDIIRKTVLRGYVASIYSDKITSLEDIEEIQYKKGRKLLFKYKY